MSIEDIDRLQPLTLRHPMFDDLRMILVESRIEEVQIYPTVTEDELVNDLGLKIVLSVVFS